MALPGAMLEGIDMSHSDKVRLLEDRSVLVRRQLNPRKVALLSGGGSVHICYP